MKHYRYDIDKAIELGVTKHPQVVLYDMGERYEKCEAFPIADCWIFRFAEEMPHVPPYMTQIGDDFKFSDED